ncbi:hypothetical protein DYB37_010474 [Aphanomyces astaci]|uniref:Uncharacterized protein n=1 Tax=Aphanomyces astaci TaxID=112090 RepID=A0A418CXG1_APHAT|nr:hypothetical protein DYB35_010091 [Aphanomyces astaci]RHZ12063.1 hypothetical protein DYB37_010474 [Aphanomyces astaci]
MYQSIPPSEPAPPLDPNAAPSTNATPVAPVDLQYQLYQQQQQQRYQTARQPSASSFFKAPPTAAAAPKQPPRPTHVATAVPVNSSNQSPYTSLFTRTPQSQPQQSSTRPSAFSRYLARLGRSLALLGLSIFSAVFSVGTLGLFMILTSFASGWLSVLFTTFFVLNLLICFIGPLTKLDVYLSHQRHLLQQAVLAESVDIFGDCGS